MSAPAYAHRILSRAAGTEAAVGRPQLPGDAGKVGQVLDDGHLGSGSGGRCGRSLGCRSGVTGGSLDPGPLGEHDRRIADVVDVRVEAGVAEIAQAVADGSVTKRDAIAHLESAAALRAVELDCDAILKGTNVDGVYDKDPNQHADAVRFDRISHDEALRRGLKVMDQTAFALCRDRNMTVVVFDLRVPQNLVGLIEGTVQGTVVSRD